jgi:ketosteroid isomerase-like protein
MKAWVVILLVVFACMLFGCAGPPVGDGPSSPPRSSLPSSEAQVVIRDVQEAWDHYVEVLLDRGAPVDMRLWSREPERTWAEGDVQFVCDRFEDLGVEQQGDSATGRAVFHVVETQWSTGESQSEDYDVEYVVTLRRESDGGWRVMQAPDCHYVLR